MSNSALAEYGALFKVDGERFLPTPLARGPWDPRALHGGPPSALLARAVEQHDPGPACFVGRLTVELLRPVPLAPLDVSVRTLRPGRKVQWIEASLRAADVEVARAIGLRLRLTDEPIDVGPDAHPLVEMLPAPESIPSGGFSRDVDAEVGFWSANDLRVVRGMWPAAGPGAAWFRLLCPVVEGEEASPLQRVAAAADFGSGIGNPVRPESLGAINPDLTIHLHHAPEGEWIGLDSRAWAAVHGVGMAETLLLDTRGPIGRAVQSLLVEERVPGGARAKDAQS